MNFTQLRLATVTLLCAALVGCGGTKKDSKEPGNSTTNKAGKKLKIAVVPKGTTHEFWKSVHAGAAKAAKELGEVEIFWNGPTSEDKRDEQITIVQNFVAKRVDGLCLAPLDSQALITAVKSAKLANIPTVIFDSGLADESLIVSYVATDNFHGGQVAAEALAKEMGSKGNVILLRYAPGSESTEQREKGFLDGLKKYPDMKIVAEDYAGSTETTALEKAQALVAPFKNKTDGLGIFACNESSASGMLRALEDTGMAGKVKFIGFDTSPHLIQAIKDGKLHGVVLQDPVTMGYQAVKTIVAQLRGEEVKKRVPTGEYLANKANLEDPEIKKRLEPEQFAD